MSDWTLWRGVPLRNERRDCTQSRSHECSSIDHSRNFWPHEPEEDDGDKPGPIGTLWGNCLGWVALRREQWERLERSHREIRATGRKVRPVTDVTCTALGKRRNGSTPVCYLGWIALRREQRSMYSHWYAIGE
jgi:hypothetical protein